MAWDVEYTNEFGDWFVPLDEDDQDSIRYVVEMLMERGPDLKRPFSGEIHGSRHSHMRELVVQSHGRPIRIFYAFDPRRAAILLIGGDKTGNKRFYDQMIPKADDLYDIHIQELKDEGLIK